MAEKQTKTHRPKTLRGVVVSDKMKDTAVVLVERYVRHPKYQKYVRLRKRYKVHNPGNTHKEGEKVTIVEGRPVSKTKRFRIAE